MLFVYTNTRYTLFSKSDIINAQGVKDVFELKTNEEIGVYLRDLILSKYPSCRQFCIAYVDLAVDYSNDINDQRSEEIRKLTNRLSQILKGKKSIQTYDLPIFSELLDVSCEQMLSAGANCVPKTNRRTNYNIAFSTDERDWIDYINREDCIAAYTDEFGKTVLDYALEFKNYGFIRFLIDNGYITLVSGNDGWKDGFNFGADTSIKTRPYEANTLQNQFYENVILRTQIISLALENNDYDVLYEMKAREIPPQLTIVPYNPSLNKFNDYYDEHFIDAILRSKSKVIKYFCEEYVVECRWQKEIYSVWLYPFFGELITKAVKVNSNKANVLLDTAIKHNEEIYNRLRKAILAVAKELKENLYRNQSFQDVIKNVLRDYRVNQEDNVVSFSYHFVRNSDTILSNIVCAKVNSKNLEIQVKLDKLNELYSKIINLQNYLIKK